MTDLGLTITPGDDMTRIQVSCEHLKGMIYVVPAERSWVCAGRNLPAHALAGFFRELATLKQPALQELMRQWGIYFRELPRDGGQAEDPPAAPPAASDEGPLP